MKRMNNMCENFEKTLWFDSSYASEKKDKLINPIFCELLKQELRPTVPEPPPTSDFWPNLDISC